ncbi:MAG: formylglycine-generating enzyme family protein [Cyanobacteria bacterium J06641_5]
MAIEEQEGEIAALEAQLGITESTKTKITPAEERANAGTTIYEGSVDSTTYTKQQDVVGIATGNREGTVSFQIPVTKLATPENFVADLGLDNRLEMLWIPGGEFVMGAPGQELESEEDSGHPQHLVEVAGFYLGKFPITQAQWQVVAVLPPVARALDPDPSNFKGEKLPVEQVSWDDAVEFCARLSRETGKVYRLPAEAEWEYACRAGTKTPFCFGKTLAPNQANYDGSTAYAGGPIGEWRQRTTNVGRFPANAFGLHDMHGNLWEWCADDWHHGYDGAPVDGSAWLLPASDRSKNALKVVRGGSWYLGPSYCRSACRDFSRCSDRFYTLGFRVCCEAP